jgi:hypothetical protein
MKTLSAMAKISGHPMKTKLQCFFIGVALLTGIHEAIAQVMNLGIAQVSGGQSLIYWPISSTTNYVLQTTTNLASPNWVMASNAVTVNAATVTNSAPAGYFRLLQSTTPPGMVLIPAGSFLIGNYIVNNFYKTATNDPDINANPTNVYVSAFYMDVNLVNSNQWAAVQLCHWERLYLCHCRFGEGEQPSGADGGLV